MTPRRIGLLALVFLALSGAAIGAVIYTTDHWPTQPNDVTNLRSVNAIVQDAGVLYANGAVPADSYTVLQWTLGESATPWANTGTAGALDMTAVAAGPAASFGVFGLGSALNFPGPQASAKYLSTGVGGTATGETAYPITLSCYVYPTDQATQEYWTAKAYATTAGTPSIVFGLIQNGYGGGRLSFYVTIAGTLHEFNDGASGRSLNLGAWNHIGATYDGAYAKVYINGVLVVTTAQTGAIDYGTHGPWEIGGYIGTANAVNNGNIAYVRLDHVIRDSAWFQKMYHYVH